MALQITEAQFEQINSALLTAVGVTSVHAREVHDKMLKASIVMDDIVDASELAKTKPLSTYPEDRDALLALCAQVEKSCDDEAAVKLADHVKAILEDEAV